MLDFINILVLKLLMKESPAYPKSWKKGQIPIDILFPNKYFGGAYHLGMHILYNLIMEDARFVAHKVYSDEGKLSSTIIMISVSYERDYPRIPKLLKQNGISLDKNRKEIIICGGPAVMLNSKPVESYADMIVHGDAEAIVPGLLEAYTGQEKSAYLDSVKHHKGVHIPGLNKKTTLELDNLNDAPYPLYQPLPEELTREFVFGNTFLLEIERSCPHHCSFCIIPAVNKKTKMRTYEHLKKIIDEGIRINKRNNITIYSPAFTHIDRKKILRYIISKGLTFSVPSLRAELVDDELLDLIKQGGQNSITIAPEAPMHLRKSIKKYIPDRTYEEAIAKAKAHGMSVKLYMMIGLPGMTDSDVIEMAKWLNKQGIYASINPLVPKLTTDVEKHPFDTKVIKHQIDLLKKHLKIKHKIANLDTSEEEYELGMSGYL